MVVYFLAQLKGPPPHLVLQPEELDRACWLPLPAAASLRGGLERSPGAAVAAVTADGAAADVDADDLAGLWPNDRGGGLTRGTVFALAVLARRA